MKDCQKYQTMNSSYIDFFELKQFNFARPIGYLVKVEFFVQSNANFRILLSETNTPVSLRDLSYEFGKQIYETEIFLYD